MIFTQYFTNNLLLLNFYLFIFLSFMAKHILKGGAVLLFVIKY